MGELLIGGAPFASHAEGRYHSHEGHPEVGNPLHRRLRRQPNALHKDVGKENYFAVLRRTKGFGRARDPHPYRVGNAVFCS
ncbi:unnamed protein product [Prunus armeniaca]